MKNKYLYRLVLCAMFLAMGLVLPFFTGQIKQIGNMLLPMHIPVFICGLLCGWKYGLAVGLITPLMRSALFHMPVMFPNAVAMAFELATYGFVIGIMYSLLKKKHILNIYICLISAMLAGRIVWGIVECLILGIGNNGFTLSAFIAGAFLNSIPGIIVQLILIPLIMVSLKRTKVIAVGQ